MTEQISEWLRYCDGDESFERSHFITLLSSHRSDQDLREIFQHVSQPYRDRIIANLCAVHAATRPDSAPYLKPRVEAVRSGAELASICEKFLESLKKHMLSIEIEDETAQWLRDSKLETIVLPTGDVRSFIDGEEDWKCQLIQEEGDNVRSVDDWGLPMKQNDDPGWRVMSGIKEGLYGLATDFQLGWFVLQPILKSTVDYKLYFDFWRQGGEYEITETHLVISSFGY